MNETARRIALQMEEKRISYHKLEELTGISRSSLHRYTTCATQKIKITNIEKIAIALGVSSSYLMCWTDDPIPKTKANAPGLTEDEQMLIDLFRQIPEDRQEYVLDLIRTAIKIQG